MQRSKVKTLLVFKFLNEYSDEENPLSTSDIIDLLQKEGMFCERKSIYADIDALRKIGYNIVSVNAPKRGFFMAERKFQLAEVRLLTDAVSSAGFITPDKTKVLLDKLESLVSSNQAKKLVSQVYVDSNAKCDNEEIYYVIDALHEAINNKKMVKFTYKRRTIDKETRKAYTEKTFKVSPYALIWKEDHYYLVCNNDKYDNLMNLRLDRIRKISMTDEPCRPVCQVSEYKEDFDVADYASKMFNMFSGTSEQVKLLCSLDLREEIMDRFGAKIPLTAVDTNHFETTISAAVSDGLVSWIMQYGNKIKVIEPASLACQVKEKAKSIAKLY